MKKICVFGLGYIGLPTASIFAMNGFKVIGVDVKKDIIEKINNGILNIKEPGLHTTVQAAINSGNLSVSIQPEKSDIFIITVPTPFRENKKQTGNNKNIKEADLNYISDAAEEIVPFLEKGNIVILESTSPPGTTKDFLVPMLEKSGLKIGDDVYIAYCPERVLPGRILKEFIENDRVIGGINRESALAVKEIYERVVEGNIYLTDSTTAEMVKLMENIYRDVNIALANELAILSNKFEVNAWEVLKLANKHPRVNIHNPGPGVGGHCISVDPWFVIEKSLKEAKLIKLARSINDYMPFYVVSNIKRLIKKIRNPKVSILGVSYKGNVDDIRESPAIEVCNGLRKMKVKFSIYDPYVKEFNYELSGFEETFKNSDLIVILADHSEFRYIDPSEINKVVRNKSVYDTRNCIDQKKWEECGYNIIL